MSTVSEPPAGANVTPSVRWDDAASVRAFLTATREQVQDLASAARDATRRFRRRVLSRPEARRQSKAAERALLRLIEAMERGLPAGVD